jgi:hypothetical protein
MTYPLCINFMNILQKMHRSINKLLVFLKYSDHSDLRPSKLFYFSMNFLSDNVLSSVEREEYVERMSSSYSVGSNKV